MAKDVPNVHHHIRCIRLDNREGRQREKKKKNIKRGRCNIGHKFKFDFFSSAIFILGKIS